MRKSALSLVGVAVMGATVFFSVGSAQAAPAKTVQKSISTASCTVKTDPAPYISVGTHVELYYNICQTSGWYGYVALQRKDTLQYKTLDDRDENGAQNIRAKFSKNCDGDGTDKYRGLWKTRNALGTNYGPYTTDWKSLAC